MHSHPGGFATVEEAAHVVANYNSHRPKPRDASRLERNLRLRQDGRYYWHWDPKLFSSDSQLADPIKLPHVFQHYRNVHLPVLLVRGLMSDLVTDSGVEDFRRHVPQLEAFEVDGAGHIVAGDRNDAFNAGVFIWIATCR